MIVAVDDSIRDQGPVGSLRSELHPRCHEATEEQLRSIDARWYHQLLVNVSVGECLGREVL